MFLQPYVDKYHQFFINHETVAWDPGIDPLLHALPEDQPVPLTLARLRGNIVRELSQLSDEDLRDMLVSAITEFPQHPFRQGAELLHYAAGEEDREYGAPEAVRKIESGSWEEQALRLLPGMIIHQMIEQRPTVVEIDQRRGDLAAA
jgi:hypothetical protein